MYGLHISLKQYSAYYINDIVRSFVLKALKSRWVIKVIHFANTRLFLKRFEMPFLRHFRIINADFELKSAQIIKWIVLIAAVSLHFRS